MPRRGPSVLDAEAREKADQDARQQEQRQDAAETRPHHTFDLTRDEIEQEARAAMRFEREHDALQRNLKSAQDERSKSGAGIVAGISSTASYSGLRDSVAAVSGMMDRLGAGDSAGKLLLAIPDSWLLGQAVPSLSSSSVPRALFMESVKAEMQTMDDVCVAIKDFGSPGHESRISFDDNVARFREALSPQVALAATLGTAAEKTRETLEIFGYMPYDPEEVENNPLLKYPLSYADFRLGVEVQELSQPALLRIFPVLPEQKVKDKIYKSWAIQE